MVGRLPTLKYLLAAVSNGSQIRVRPRLPAGDLGVGVDVDGDEIVDVHRRASVCARIARGRGRGK